MTYNADDLADLLASAIPAANMDLDHLQIVRTEHGPAIALLVDADQYLVLDINGPYTTAELREHRKAWGWPEPGPAPELAGTPAAYPLDELDPDGDPGD